MVLFNMSDTSELKRPFIDSTILNKLREILIEKGIQFLKEILASLILHRI